MPRPPKWRRVEFVPEITHFKPAGVPLRGLEEIILTVEELEAIRLKDREGLDQEACAERMRISRPTFHRIIGSARGKVAEALVEGKAIRIAGGRYRVDKRYFRCGTCHYDWEEPFGSGPGREIQCPRCDSPNIDRINGEDGWPGRHRRGHGRRG